MFSDTFIGKLKSAHTVVVLTGAGISAESGVPTFRGDEGLWKQFRPEELANFDAFIRNPKLVWEWYNYRKTLISQVNPNPGHYALVKLESMYDDFHLITQNVDNLHQRAGSKRIYELHGNIMRNRCVDCNKRWDTIPHFNGAELPRCDCGGLIRPDVVWFGEALPHQVLLDSFAAAESADVFLTIGTSAVVQPAASLPIEAKHAGAYVVEINTNPTAITNLVDEAIMGKSGEILPQLIERLSMGES
ncbi:MAG: NAD-dependent deacylase [candidate division KSB1 bacterium]|nr:NAD-dependent deacylase [candidate division KSB1 bacterium]MDZ7335573.1 NAD-dependent deacylase [candidate division KSB1 bacterium]MDZ7356445.1 NAD-dependent deacylase [candidate division KSB1 bacterium]MDZ7401216.1 NAD-dependent deacylase [candidate division KSB1 bacterium]